jgi:hypothetical protein
MKTRKYSDKFIDSEIGKIDRMNEKCQEEFPILPEALYGERYSWLIPKIKEVMDHRSKMSYIKGFWYAWALRNGMKE